YRRTRHAVSLRCFPVPFPIYFVSRAKRSCDHRKSTLGNPAMPTLARLFIKTALVYLGAALLVGVVMAGGSFVGFGGAYGMLWPVYLHLFVVGWLTELIFGVAYWLFPRHSRERPHGTTWPVAAS